MPLQKYAPLIEGTGQDAGEVRRPETSAASANDDAAMTVSDCPEDPALKWAWFADESLSLKAVMSGAIDVIVSKSEELSRSPPARDPKSRAELLARIRGEPPSENGNFDNIDGFVQTAVEKHREMPLSPAGRELSARTRKSQPMRILFGRTGCIHEHLTSSSSSAPSEEGGLSDLVSRSSATGAPGTPPTPRQVHSAPPSSRRSKVADPSPPRSAPSRDQLSRGALFAVSRLCQQPSPRRGTLGLLESVVIDRHECRKKLASPWTSFDPEAVSLPSTAPSTPGPRERDLATSDPKAARARVSVSGGSPRLRSEREPRPRKGEADGPLLVDRASIPCGRSAASFRRRLITISQ